MDSSDIELAPWMVEEAYKYAKAAQVLYGERNLANIAQTNAVLSIEISLKSLLAKNTHYIGRAHQNSRFDKSKMHSKNLNSHDLVDLYDSIDSDLKKGLFVGSEFCVIQRYRKSFVDDRYRYEFQKNRPAINYSLGEISMNLVERVVKIYLLYGSEDPWINAYPNI